MTTAKKKPPKPSPKGYVPPRLLAMRQSKKAGLEYFRDQRQRDALAVKEAILHGGEQARIRAAKRGRLNELMRAISYLEALLSILKDEGTTIESDLARTKYVPK